MQFTVVEYKTSDSIIGDEQTNNSDEWHSKVIVDAFIDFWDFFAMNPSVGKGEEKVRGRRGRRG